MPSITITANQAKRLAKGLDIAVAPDPPAPKGDVFNDGDIVAGPFVVDPDLLDVVTVKDAGGRAYGLGLGVVDSSVRLFSANFVPVRVVVGDRTSGGYHTDQLTKIEGAELR